MMSLKYLMALLVGIYSVLVPVSAEPVELPEIPPNGLPNVDIPPKGTPDLNALDIPPITPINLKMYCSPVQKYLCCDDPKIKLLETVKGIICADVEKTGCPDITEKVCSANSTTDLLDIKNSLLFNAKNAICCDNRNIELIESVKKMFCSKVIKIVCCTGANATDIDSVKKDLCATPCDKEPCENDGTCTFSKEEGRVCHCVDPYYGDNCEEEDICYDNPCKNGGTCIFDKVSKEVTCKCVTPYFGDRCEFKCCDETDYDWSDDKNGAKPDTAVNGCNSGNCDLYVARAKPIGKEDYVPGKLIKQFKACYVPNGEVEDKVNEYQVLYEINGKKMSWVKAIVGDNDAPQCAIESKEKALYYIGRGKAKEVKAFSTGNVRNSILTTTYKGKSYTNTATDGFDYLICKEETK